MAAILCDPEVAPEAPARRPSRPRLQLIDGGRSPGSAARYRRRRMVAAGIATVAVLVAVSVGWWGLHALTSGWEPVPAHRPAKAGSGPVVVVRPGDTLWSLASRLRPGDDPRPLVDRLEAVHGPGPLQVGERIPLAGVVGG